MSAGLNGWAPAHAGGWWIEDEGRGVLAFWPEGDPVPYTYFLTPDGRETAHVLRCSSCGTDDREQWFDAPMVVREGLIYDTREVRTYDAPEPSTPEVWTCPTCGSGRGETREVPVEKPKPKH